ncbi:MAG: hypothetical protein AYP45_17670 [Candidatus Brocadia carolinensis]|uniref:Uncharacterized protein n=1 Tax=Candidatus Brocadia carolinensis TaxID=1004156 RepID=A0A1V4AP62_9BACT|nr:MAG: hypothetical protein AYP45_17670 [Candidatus Brocadia caroliniensis]
MNYEKKIIIEFCLTRSVRTCTVKPFFYTSVLPACLSLVRQWHMHDNCTYAEELDVGIDVVSLYIDVSLWWVKAACRFA